MRAVGFNQTLPVDDPKSLLDITFPTPIATGCDLLVEVMAVSVNPADVKQRGSANIDGSFRVLGYDACGRVRALGDRVTLFRPGDDVFYAGDLRRSGTNAELHLVDERIVGRKPKNLTFAEAAALPLTSITAWELLFDKFRVAERGGNGDTLLIIAGAGGVGSMLIQLAKKLTRLRVIATASREDSREWCLSLGSDAVIDHRGDLGAQLKTLGSDVRYVAGLGHTQAHLPAILDCINPFGEIALIDQIQAPDFRQFKNKALSIHWVFMFSRAMFGAKDIQRQHEILNSISDLAEQGKIISTMRRNYGTINADNLRRAHAFQESSAAIGKTVLEGFDK